MVNFCKWLILSKKLSYLSPRPKLFAVDMEPRLKTIWFFGLLSVVLTLTLVGYNVHMQKKFVLQEAHSNASNLMDLVEMDLVRTFSSLDQTFVSLENHLTSGPLGKQADAPEVRRIIDDLVLQNSYLTSLMVLDAEGRILHWNNNFQKPNLSQRPYFNIHRSVPFDGLFFSLPQTSVINQGQRSCHHQ